MLIVWASFKCEGSTATVLVFHMTVSMFLLFKGSWYYTRKWVWNLTTKVCYIASGKWNLSVSLQGFVYVLCLKLVSAILNQIFVFHQMIALQKLWKMFFISFKKLFRSRDIQIFVFSSSPLFLPVSHCFRGWSKKNLKVYEVINCLNKNLITYFVWYLEKEKRYDIETLIEN